MEKAEKAVHQSTGAISFGIKYKDQKPDDIPGIYVSDSCIYYTDQAKY